MKIKSIASSSKGNCYIIESGGKQLIIDCGIPLKRIRAALNHDLSNVVGCLVSHSHGDHGGYLPQLEKETSIPIYCTDGTSQRYNINGHYLINDINIDISNFTVKPLLLNHDVECFGFLIMGDKNLLFYATDTSEVNYTIKGLTHLMIECNYSFEKLVESEHNKSLIKRICETHLSLDDVVEFVKRHPDLEEIWLLHLSSRHSDAELFKKTIQDLTGILVYVADE